MKISKPYIAGCRRIKRTGSFPSLQRFVQGFVGGYYNRYYLAELEDGSWLCVCFDDYLAWTGADNYPIGYVCYTTTEERRMLNRMAEDYDVDPVYVLDMYQHGKASWMLDFCSGLSYAWSQP